MWSFRRFKSHCLFLGWRYVDNDLISSSFTLCKVLKKSFKSRLISLYYISNITRRWLWLTDVWYQTVFHLSRKSITRLSFRSGPPHFRWWRPWFRPPYKHAAIFKSAQAGVHIEFPGRWIGFDSANHIRFQENTSSFFSNVFWGVTKTTVLMV